MSRAPRRFPVSDLNPELVTLPEATAKHLRVLRLEPGTEVILFDGRGMEATAVVESVHPLAQCRILSRSSGASGAVSDGKRIHLLMGIPKGKKLDSVVRMVTELGAASVWLMKTERVEGFGDDSRWETKRDRLVRVAIEASRQAGRADVPAIEGPMSLDSIREGISDASVRLLFDPIAEPMSNDAWNRVLSVDSTKPNDIFVAIGPEGGFSEQEREGLLASGFRLCSLGDTILRTETAPVAAIAIVRDRARER